MPFATYELPGTGAAMPAIAFGTGSDWRSNPRPVGDDGVAPAVVDAVTSAAAAGFRHFDCAENYKNELSVGAGLKATGLPRSELFITSKVHRSLARLEEEVQRQLELLQVKQLDLYLVHTPKACEPAGMTLEQAWKRMEVLVDEGLVRAIGVSNYTRADFEAFLPTARHRPVLNQISIYPYIYHRQLPEIEYAEAQGIKIEAYEVSSTIIRESEKGGPLDPVLEEIVADLKKQGTTATPGQILLAWAAAHGWLVVTTSSKAERQQEYIAAGEITLSPAQVQAIDDAGKAGAEQGYGKYTSW
ncbi:hypothetical protein JCM10207_001778 [Rhodosporidiobolus poonsookiae]